MKFEGAGFALVNRHAKYIGRQQIAGELDPLKLQADGACKSMRERGLADAGYILYEQVAACQHAGYCHPDRVLLAQDDLVQLVNQVFERGALGGEDSGHGGFN